MKFDKFRVKYVSYKWITISLCGDNFISFGKEGLHLWIDNNMQWDVTDNYQPVIEGVDEV